MRRSGAVVIAAIACLGLAAPAHAATFNVNSTADDPDANTGVAACATAGGDCTLRAAIDQANADNSDSTINLPAGMYTLTGANGEDSNASGDLDVNSRGFQVAIVGAGARTTVIDGNQVDRVFHVGARSRLAIRGVTITGGLASDPLSDGGGIYMDGGSTATALTVTDSTIAGNTARVDATAFILDGDGGGIHTGEDSTVAISGTTITNNEAADDGGGIENDAASLSITNSTINGNRALGEAVPGDPEDDLGNGGGIEHNEGQMQVVHTTIADNVAADNGGGVNVEDEVVDQETPPAATFRSTILSGNQAATAGPNCRPLAPATLASGGTNLESGTDCGFTGGGSLQSSNPQLGALANNGGQTDTRALPSGSPALNRATSAPCPPTDQRGITRPQGAACDIGAYERVVQADVGVVMSDSPDPVKAGANLTYRVLGGNGGPDPATNTKLTVNLPGGVDLQSSSVQGGGSCTGSSTLTCSLGDLATGARTLVTVIVKIPASDTQSSAATTAQAADTLAASARIAATETDPVSSNNEARITTAVQSGAGTTENDESSGGGTEGAVAGTSASAAEGSSGLAFTGLPLAIVLMAGAWMLGAGLTLRRLALFVG